jgi:hypothetical protein
VFRRRCIAFVKISIRLSPEELFKTLLKAVLHANGIK